MTTATSSLPSRARCSGLAAGRITCSSRMQTARCIKAQTWLPTETGASPCSRTAACYVFKEGPAQAPSAALALIDQCTQKAQDISSDTDHGHDGELVLLAARTVRLHCRLQVHVGHGVACHLRNAWAFAHTGVSLVEHTI